MSDMINRDEVLAIIADLKKDYPTHSVPDAEAKVALRKVADKIRAIDAESVEHGEWIPHPTEKEWDVCTACGTGCKRREIWYDTYFERPYVTEYGYPFCPNCGADMRKRKGE